MKIYLNLLQLCIVNHRLFFFRGQCRKSNSTPDIKYYMPLPRQWRFQHMLLHHDLEL